MNIPRGDAVALLEALVRIDSRNPLLVPGAPGEGEVARRLADVLTAWGLETHIVESAPGRANVVARRRGRGGRMYGRGASDMKGGVAAMCAAAARLPALDGDVLVTAVCDEEWQSAGTASLLRSGMRADAAIVTEPTGLAIMPAHKGFVWAEICVRGRAAHGSRWDLGVDAIRHAGSVLAELDALERSFGDRRHSLLGRPSLHASTIEGGTGMSTYPDSCVLRLERRTIPGETLDAVRRELEDAIGRAAQGRDEFAADIAVLFAQPASDVPDDSPLVRTLAETLGERGLSRQSLGMSAWTDAALLNEAGIPAICFGPGDMGLAHAAEEYIEIAQVEQATDILVSFAERWCKRAGPAE